MEARACALVFALSLACGAQGRDSSPPARLARADTSAGTGPARWHDYPEADALGYEIELVLDPRRSTLQGEVRYRFKAVQALREVQLDSVASKSWSPHFFQAHELVARRSGDHLALELETPVAAGQEFAFRAELSGAPPDGLYFGRTRAGEPCVFTDHYSVRARGWLPCEDHPADRAAVCFRLALPEGYQVVCSGALAPLSAPANWVPAGFAGWTGESASELPTYLFALAAAPYARVEEPGDPRLVPHFIYRPDVERARPALRFHAAWMQRMEQLIGPYPFEKYCVVQVPTRWGGMENAGNTWVMEGLFDGERAGIGTLAHEFAHQWFGDGVGYADWFEVWLSEGFASYFGPLLDAESGGPALEQSLREMRERWRASPEGSELPVRWKGYANPDQALNSNTYPKGAWILHMLRCELGDEAFFAGLRRYYRDNTGRSVHTDELRAALEAESGRDLAAFFRQWLDRPGCPELRCRWSASGLSVLQLQAEPYDFLLPLCWKDAAGAEREGSFRIREASTELELQGAPISDGELDPHAQLLYRLR